MTKYLLSAAFALVAAGTASAATPTEYSFTRDGLVYQVSETNLGDHTLLEGRDSLGRKFSFRVEGKKVDGHYDGERTRFSIAKPLKPTTLASR